MSLRKKNYEYIYVESAEGNENLIDYANEGLLTNYRSLIVCSEDDHIYVYVKSRFFVFLNKSYNYLEYTLI